MIIKSYVDGKKLKQTNYCSENKVETYINTREIKGAREMYRGGGKGGNQKNKRKP